MNSREVNRNNEDIGLVGGLALFIVLLVLYGVTEARNVDFTYLQEVRAIMEGHLPYLTAILIGCAFNAFYLTAVLGRWFGYKKQGSRLNSLLGKRRFLNQKELKRWSYSIALGAGFSWGVGRWTPFGWTESLAKVLSVESIIVIQGMIAMSFGVTVTILAALISRMKVWEALAQGSANTLPKYPRKENTIVLGSYGELSSTGT